MVAPSLIAAGVNMYAAHFFSFYFAIVSNITPPVALTAFVAAVSYTHLDVYKRQALYRAASRYFLILRT